MGRCVKNTNIDGRTTKGFHPTVVMFIIIIIIISSSIHSDNSNHYKKYINTNIIYDSLSINNENIKQDTVDQIIYKHLNNINANIFSYEGYNISQTFNESKREKYKGSLKVYLDKNENRLLKITYNPKNISYNNSKDDDWNYMTELILNSSEYSINLSSQSPKILFSEVIDLVQTNIVDGKLKEITAYLLVYNKNSDKKVPWVKDKETKRLTWCISLKQYEYHEGIKKEVPVMYTFMVDANTGEIGLTKTHRKTNKHKKF